MGYVFCKRCHTRRRWANAVRIGSRPNIYRCKNREACDKALANEAGGDAK